MDRSLPILGPGPAVRVAWRPERKRGVYWVSVELSTARHSIHRHAVTRRGDQGTAPAWCNNAGRGFVPLFAGQGGGLVDSLSKPAQGR